MKYILALDQGTTSSRSLVVDHDGNIIGMAQKEFRQIFPKPGWVEHDASEIWSSQAAVVAEVLASLHLTMRDIAGIGITNQRETTIVWDKKTSRPICHAIVWQDRRTTKICEELKMDHCEPVFREKTGLLLDPYFSGTKLKWILDHIPDARRKAEKGELAFGTVDSWLVWKLSEGRHHVTDPTNACRTLLYNIHKKDWDEELLKILNIPRSMLPEVKDSSEIYGECSGDVCSIPTPISGIAGDQQAALFGQSCLKKGMGKVTYGTGCFILMNTGDQPVQSNANLLATIAYKIGSETKYAIEGSVFIGGAVVQWLRDNLGIIRTSGEVEALARTTADSEGVVFVPAFTGLGCPYWDPKTRGGIMGLTRGTTKAHIARAAIEGIAFQVADVIEAMKKQVSIQELRVDGGAVDDNLLMQIQTDFLNIPLIRPKWKEVTALGACFLAGLAVGFWKDQADIEKLWKKDQEFLPLLDEDQLKERRKLWRKTIECLQEWSNK